LPSQNGNLKFYLEKTLGPTRYPTGWGVWGLRVWVGVSGGNGGGVVVVVGHSKGDAMVTQNRISR